MKKIYFLIIFLFTCASIFAQVVYTEPEFATESDSIVLYFDATQAERQDLVGYSGDLYVHTGVTTNQGEWRYVIESWGNNSTQPQLERIATDLYKLVIGFPREFYSITNPEEKIITMNFVFRSADATSQTEDIFYTLFTPGITAVIDSPAVNIEFGDVMRSPRFYNPGDEIGFKIKVAPIDLEVDSINIYKNNVLVSTSQGANTLNYVEVADNKGNYHYQIIVKDVDGMADTTYFGAVVNGEIVEENLPSGVEPGVNFMNDGTAVLAVFAPYKEFIHVIGNFNDWYVDENFLMKKYAPSPDSVVYWLRLDDIVPEQVYQYQYLMDGELRIADPYAELILDPWNDQYINAETYPELPDYPGNKTEHLVSAFEKRSEAFQWTDQDYIKPDKEKLVIYELLIRDFTEEHTYTSTLEKLDYLDSLGVNVIELLPVNEFEGNSSWGYNPSMYFAVDKYYGTADDLKNFVNECHRRGMAVVTDVVYNHAFGTNSMARMYLNDAWQPSAENPWFNTTAPHTDYSWGYDFDHESKHTKYFLDRANRFWVEDFHIDGFRFDFTRGFTNKSGGSGAYDAGRITILKRMADEIWETNPSTFVILEHLVNENSGEMKELADYGMLLWGNMNHSYNEASMGYGSDLSWGYYKTRGWSEPNLVTYMESHDEERLMYKNLQYGNSSGDYNIQHLYTALQRQKLVNAFFLTIPGPKMIWQFGELGYDYSIDYNGRTGEKPIRWNYYDDANRGNLYKTIKALLKLRENHDVFTSKNTQVNLDVDGTVKTIKLTGSPNVLIAGNFGVNATDVTLNFVHGGNWYDYFSGDTINVVSSYHQNLAAGEFHIYTDGKLEAPESDILVGAGKEEKSPEEFEVYPAYPNPFNPETNLAFNLPHTGDVTFLVYNILGEKVYSRHYDNMAGGYHRISWNTNDYTNLASGIYVLNLIFGNKKETLQVLLLK